MAARENQSYVIAIIALAVIAVMLLVSTVVFAMRWNDAYDKMAAAQSDSTYQKAMANAFEAQSNMYAACIGVEGKAASEIEVFKGQIVGAKSGVDASRADEIQSVADAAEAVYEIYQKDMAFNSAITDEGEGAAEVGMTYKGTVDKMASALRSSNENAFGKTKEVQRVLSETATQISTLNNTLAERTKALTQREEDLAAEKQRNADAEAGFENQNQMLQAAMDEQKNEFETQQEILRNDIDTLENTNRDLAMENTSLKDKVNEYEREVFDMTDGEIVRVATESNSVFIDLGRLDGVRPNLTFTIYDRTATDFEKDRHKAKIEVTEIVGPHLAKARITEQDPLNPILTKDQVLSATFDRGDAVTIALGGFFDLDGDGISDVEKLKRMIVRNGGRVVASHDEEGNITGKIDSSTRFFVRGPSPKTGISNVTKAVATMQEQAKGNSVDVIDLRKLQNWMGVHGNARIERMDRRIGEPGGFAPRSPSGQ